MEGKVELKRYFEFELVDFVTRYLCYDVQKINGPLKLD